MKRRVSIDEGRINAEMYGATYRAAYAETVVAGVPHIVDAKLVEGYSSLDHMADVPLASIVRRAGEMEYQTVAGAKSDLAKAGRKSLAGAPRIDVTLTPGSLCQRWQSDNAASADRLAAKAAGHGVYLTREYRKEKGGDDCLCRQYSIRLDGCHVGGVCLWTPADDYDAPDCDWTVGECRWAD